MKHHLVAHAAEEQLGHLSAPAPADDDEVGLLLVGDVHDHRRRPAVLEDGPISNARGFQRAAPLVHKVRLDSAAHVVVEI